jgi:plastocyanin
MRTRLQRAALLLAPMLLPVMANAATHTVTIENMQFSPATITVHPGDRIVWRNTDLVPHTATARGRFDSGAIAPGHSWTHVAPPPGRYDYVCTFHPGMKATLVVQ